MAHQPPLCVGSVPHLCLNPSLIHYTESTLASLDACTKLEDFLLARVKKNNHNIKRKALLIIKVRRPASHPRTPIHSMPHPPPSTRTCAACIHPWFCPLRFVSHLASMWHCVAVPSSSAACSARQRTSKRACVRARPCVATPHCYPAPLLFPLLTPHRPISTTRARTATTTHLPCALGPLLTPHPSPPSLLGTTPPLRPPLFFFQFLFVFCLFPHRVPRATRSVARRRALPPRARSRQGGAGRHFFVGGADCVRQPGQPHPGVLRRRRLRPVRLRLRPHRPHAHRRLQRRHERVRELRPPTRRSRLVIVLGQPGQRRQVPGGGGLQQQQLHTTPSTRRWHAP